MSAVFVVDACRTPIGKVKGALAGVRPDHLTADVITALTARNPWLDPGTIDDVYWGAANQAGEDNRNVARMGVLLAGLPVEIPGATVNRLCGSGMEAVCSAARAISAGDADVCIAGGAESMTRAPFVLPRPAEVFPREAGPADTRLGWRLVSPRMAEPIRRSPSARPRRTWPTSTASTGPGRTRSRCAATSAPAPPVPPAGSTRSSCRCPAGRQSADEGIKADTTEEELAGKLPAFRPGGTVTAGNSSPLNDGAAALILLSERGGATAGPHPLARFVAAASARAAPCSGHRAGSGHGAGASQGRLGARRPCAVELNEAFAAQAVAEIDRLTSTRRS